MRYLALSLLLLGCPAAAQTKHGPIRTLPAQYSRPTQLAIYSNDFTFTGDAFSVIAPAVDWPVFRIDNRGNTYLTSVFTQAGTPEFFYAGVNQWMTAIQSDELPRDPLFILHADPYPIYDYTKQALLFGEAGN